MPKNSFADQLQTCEKLLRAARCGEAELPGIAPFREILEQAQAHAVSVRARRDALRAAAREATREVTAAFITCHEAVSALRNYLKSVLGYRNEQLVLYGVKPIRKRRRFAVKPRG